MKVLFVSNLFPDATDSGRGIYNARLVHNLAERCEMRVVSPRPTLPFLGGEARSARSEDASLKPTFPTARYIPKIGGLLNHRLLAHSLRGELKRIHEEFPFDVVLASWLYPDACAIALLAQELEFPFVAVAQGSDVHQYLKIPSRRKVMKTCLSGASTIVTRSAELGRLLKEARVTPKNLRTIYNGVDLERFRPGDKSEARAAVNLPQPDSIILYVGNFHPVKNPLLLVRAHAELCDGAPDRVYRLIMAGNGPQLTAARQEAASLGFSKWIRFLGRVEPDRIADYMRAADVLCVPSDNEGVPNVILEAFASGLKVVATNVGGIPEIVSEECLGILVKPNHAAEMAHSLKNEIDRESDVKTITDYAANFSWENTAQAYLKSLNDAVASRD